MPAHVADLSIRADEAWADGHFPGNPIIPGAVLLREVLRVMAAGRPLVCLAIRSARFFLPVRPGERLIVRWDAQAGGEIAFTCTTAADERRVFAGTLRIRVR